MLDMVVVWVCENVLLFCGEFCVLELLVNSSRRNRGSMLLYIVVEELEHPGNTSSGIPHPSYSHITQGGLTTRAVAHKRQRFSAIEVKEHHMKPTIPSSAPHFPL